MAHRIKSDALISIERGSLSIGSNFRIVGGLGMAFSGSPSFEACEHAGDALAVATSASNWALGDFANYLEDHYGEQAAQILDHERFSESTLGVYRWVAKSVPLENRRADLEFSHHQVVAKLPPGEQRKWLEKAAKGDGTERWPVSRLKQEINVAKGKSKVVKFYVVVDAEDEKDCNTLVRQLQTIGRTPRKVVGGEKPQKPKKEITAKGKRKK
jgi:hypothetical protein